MAQSVTPAAKKEEARIPRIPRVKVADWSALQAELSKYLDGDRLFRGVSVVNYPLVPSIGRAAATGEAFDPGRERDLFDQFKRECFPHIATRPLDDWDWLALAQHCGVPTRLLDWSENPLVAAYFAVWSREDDDAGLYVIQRPPSARREAKNPLDASAVEFFYPTHVSARITAQRGIFTLHPDPCAPYAVDGALQLVIAREAKPDIRRKLDSLGVHHFSMFMDLPSLARRLSDQWRSKPNGAAKREAYSDPKRTTPMKRGKKLDPSDPQKGQWGGASTANGWKLDAKAEELEANWFEVKVWVERVQKSPRKPAPGVEFHLHDSFPSPVLREERKSSGRSILEFACYGAFTVGARVLDDGTELELDLSTLESAPRDFRQN